MEVQEQVKIDLKNKFNKVLATPASFAFYVAVHDFVKHIEQNASLSKNLSSRLKANQELKIPAKYDFLKQIYQGLEDADRQSTGDLGHARYAAILELNRIRGKEMSESNMLWKKREVLRKFTEEIYKRLSVETV